MEANSKECFKQRILSDPYFGDAVQFVFSSIGNVQNKIILDNGCGSGVLSVLFALEGGDVIGIDKCERAIHEAKRLAQSCNTDHRCTFINCKSEMMPIADASIDIIFSRSTMQYMDSSKVICEYMRVLKPSGTLAIIENLRYSPLINLFRWYRRIRAKTVPEIEYARSIRQYLTVRQIENIASGFMFSDHREYHMVRIVSMFLNRLSQEAMLMQKLDQLFARIDRNLFKLFPWLRHLAWFTALICQKKKYGQDIDQRSSAACQLLRARPKRPRRRAAERG
jgi:ubiquinone/menaquinone biosynthesis C-methylase UbiE